LNLEEDNCESMDFVNIFIQPATPEADFTFDPGKGCAPLTVNFTNLTKFGDPESYKWYFGQGEGITNEEHPTHTYYEPGVYSVKLEASNEAGITDAAVKRLIIEVFPNPHSDFQIRPETVKLPEDPIYTTNLSFEADSYFWDFGDGAISTEFEPSHVYMDTGRYDIMLIAKTVKGCIDTVVYEDIVEVIDGNEILIPNAFTPSLDGPTGGSRYTNGRNDVFYPVTEGVIAYRMQIYNRWGELLFATEDTGLGWDGYYNGRLCAPDVYIYKLDFKFIDGREVMKFGDIALIR
ncbi:MAG: PKD domain-containing protein, partial [Cyclobacteriaceae bacterium]|nr:PKD domain-containing protein [Cyclobacteriaceae bacterium]